MNSLLGKFLALFFAVCFLALQFHAVGDTQLEQSAKQIFHIEDVSSSVIDNSSDNKFIYIDIFQAKQAYLPQQKTKLLKQRQYIGAFERRADHAFRQYMYECLDAICQDYQDKLFTIFQYQQKLALTFEFNPILISNIKQVQSDESDSQFSLS
jgi:hypothetical protein